MKPSGMLETELFLRFTRPLEAAGLIVRKFQFHRAGGSDKHLRDIRAMLDRSADEIDHATLRDLIAEHDLADEWAKIA